jgi:hypothetical protein
LGKTLPNGNVVTAELGLILFQVGGCNSLELFWLLIVYLHWNALFFPTGELHQQHLRTNMGISSGALAVATAVLIVVVALLTISTKSLPVENGKQLRQPQLWTSWRFS